MFLQVTIEIYFFSGDIFDGTTYNANKGRCAGLDVLEVGSRIAAKRQEKKLTQKQLAELVHVTDKAVSKWEQGKNFPELTTIEPLSVALGISPAELLGFDKTSADDALSASIELYEEKRYEWLNELQRRSWITLVINLLISFGLVWLSRFLDSHALYGYPMSLIGAINGMMGIHIGYSFWIIRTSSKQLRRGTMNKNKQISKKTDTDSKREKNAHAKMPLNQK